MQTKNFKPGLMKRLKDQDYAAGYLANVLEYENQESFLIAVKNVLSSRSYNISKLAKKTGISRQTIYHALSKRGDPRLSTLTQLLKSIGLRISFEVKRRAA